MYSQKVLFTEEECNFLISQAGEFKPAFYFKQPECILNLDRDIINFLLEKFKHFGIIKLPNIIKMLKYTEGINFNLHIDSDGKDGRLKTVVTQLSQPDSYEGGTLELIVNGKRTKINRELGNSVIYPSSTPHEVSTITCGVRYVLVFWLKKHHLNFIRKII